MIRSLPAVMLALATLSSPVQPSPNLLTNPGFEEGLRSWTVEGDADCSPETRIVYSGRAAIRLSPLPGAASQLLLVSSSPTPAKPGETFRARFWVHAGPLSDGSEPYGALEFLRDGVRTGIVHTDFGVNRYEPNAWARLEAIGVAPEGTTSVRLSLISHPKASVRFDEAELVRLRPAPPHERSAVTLHLDRSHRISDDWRGFGCQGEILLNLKRSIEQGYTDADRRLVTSRIQEMRPKYIRLTVRFSDWEPEQGVQTPENDTLRDMVSTIALYKSVGADVQLAEWGNALPEWLRPNDRLPRPDLTRAFTDSWAAFLKYLRHDCGLTNVRYVTMHNEPNGLPWADYSAICRSLDASLKAQGIRDEIQVIGPDEACENHLLPLAIRDLHDVLDCYDGHGYTADTGADFAIWTEGRTGLVSESGPARKPFLITEFGMADGMNTWSTPHNDEYAYGIFLADCAVVSANLGVSGLVMYCIADYDCGMKMKWGLWKGKTEGWEPRPGFYSWSLLTRYTELRSAVYRLDSDAASVPATAFKAPGNGPWALIAVNRSESDRVTTITGLPARSQWKAFVYSRSTVPTTDRRMIPPGPAVIADEAGAMRLIIPGNAFVLWHEQR